MSERSMSRRSVLAVVLLTVTLLASQYATDGMAPSGTTPAGRALGRAGFAYLTGVRTFVAAVLWNRIDPLFHTYYEDTPLAEQAYVLPTIWAVVALDPQFVQAYYGGSFQLVRRGEFGHGMELARRGVQANPRSGLLLSSYAQLLWLSARDPAAASRAADRALGRGVYWTDAIEQHDGYAILRGVYGAAGMTEKRERVTAEIARLDAVIGDSLPAGAHDHDGDGEPDH